MTDSRTLPVPEGLDGERVDVGLGRLLGLSRTKAGVVIADGAVRMDGTVLGKSDRLRAGAWLEVDLPAARPAAPPQEYPDLIIRHDDEHIVVLDKPVGVAAHASPGWDGPTVTGALAAAGFQVATSGAAERQGIVHRLDVGTSGLMVVAKSEIAYSALKRAFKERTVHKIYHALLQGHPDPTHGTIDGPIGRHPKHDYKWAIVAGGREAVTHYRTVEAVRAASLCEIRLETGRTHQIRVHSAAIGHPCAGDLTYGADPALARRLGLERQWLHAMRLGFEHPGTGRPFEVTSEYPADLARALDVARR